MNRQRLWWVLLVPGVIASAVGLGWGCVQLVTQLPRNNNPAFGNDIDSLYYIICGVTGVSLFVTEGLLVYFLIRYRSREGAKAHYVHGNHQVELIWTFVPGAILFLLAIYQAGTWSKVKRHFPDETRAVVVQLLTHQFAWEFRYPGSDGTFEEGDRVGKGDDVTETNNLYVPAGKPVVMHMQSKDVIHSFKLPHYRLMQDVVPGMMIRAWFQADEPGDYPIACAELCGSNHSQMHGTLHVLTPADYDAWIAKRSAERSMNSDDRKMWGRFWSAELETKSLHPK